METYGEGTKRACQAAGLAQHRRFDEGRARPQVIHPGRGERLRHSDYEAKQTAGSHDQGRAPDD